MSTVQATNLKHGSSATNNVVLDASGNTTISGALAVSGNAVITGTLQANGVTGSVYPLVLGTAAASTSGTAIDFTGIPSWVRRVTVMFNGVSTNGSSSLIIQIGATSFLTSGYVGGVGYIVSPVWSAFTTGFGIQNSVGPANLVYGTSVLTNVSGNSWVYTTSSVNINNTFAGSGGAALAGTLDRVRITTVGGTDTFDAGSINIMFE